MQLPAIITPNKDLETFSCPVSGNIDFESLSFSDELWVLSLTIVSFSEFKWWFVSLLDTPSLPPVLLASFAPPAPSVLSLPLSPFLGSVGFTTNNLNFVSVLFPSLSVVVTVIGYSPDFVGVPLIVFVSGSNVTPSGKPVTSCVNGPPPLSFPLIWISLIGFPTSTF